MPTVTRLWHLHPQCFIPNMAQFLCSESSYTRQGMPTTRMHCDAGRVWRSLTHMPEGYANETALAMHSHDHLVCNLANILHDARCSPVIEPRHVANDNMKSRPDIRATGATGSHDLLDVTVVHSLAPSLLPSFVDTLLALTRGRENPPTQHLREQHTRFYHRTNHLQCSRRL